MKILNKAVLNNQKPTFADVKAWYNDKLHPTKLDLDDQKVYSHVYESGNWGGIFQFTARGAQAFCKRAQPKNIIDIAAITSIYRPGPLVAGVDKKFVDAKNDPESVEYPHPLVKEVLGETYGFLVFQEQMLRLGHIIGKLPLEKCDRLRKVITKRSMSGKEKAAKESEELRIEFLQGAEENGLSSNLANEIWDNMAAFKGYAFNLSHALSYAVDSYMCAWLLTYYEPEWLCAYMETQSDNPDKRSSAISELKGFGYQIVPVDINYATDKWSIIEGKKFMPSLLSVKGVGKAAIDEIEINRPYQNIYDLLWDKNNNWKHSKFNKRTFENLIKIRAFDSMQIVGENKTFNSYRQMYECIITGNHKLRSKKTGHEYLQQRIIETKNIKEWPKAELLQMSKEILGAADLSLVISQKLRNRLDEIGVKSIDDYEKQGLYWFIIDEAMPKLTKARKTYLLLQVVGTAGKRFRMYLWGWDSEKNEMPALNCAHMAEVSKSDFGFATQVFKLKSLNEVQ